MNSDLVTVGGVTIALWIGMAAFGAVVSSINLWAAHNDLKYQVGKQEFRWQRALIARVNMTNEIMRVIVHTLLFVAGVMVAWRTTFNPNPPGTSLYVRAVILLTIATLVSQTLIHRWLRVRLTRKQTP